MNKRTFILSALSLMLVLVLSVGFSFSSAASTENIIEGKMNTLMSEINSLVESKNVLSMSSNPHTYIENSSEYQEIVDLGVKAIKPLYDILYNSPDAGLREYIVALAIEDITNAEYIYHTDYGWKNSMEFRFCYESKVNNSITDFEIIMNNEKLSNQEKTEQIHALGIFAVDSLFNELDASDLKLSSSVINDSLDLIIKDQGPGLSKEILDVESWRSTNEDAYRSMMVLKNNQYKD